MLWTGVPKNQPITAPYRKDKKYDRELIHCLVPICMRTKFLVAIIFSLLDHYMVQNKDGSMRHTSRLCLISVLGAWAMPEISTHAWSSRLISSVGFAWAKTKLYLQKLGKIIERFKVRFSWYCFWLNGPRLNSLMNDFWSFTVKKWMNG